MKRKYKHSPGPLGRRLFPLDKMEEETIAFLRKYEPEEGYYLADSGGKDSRVLRKLTELSGVKYKAFHNLTTIDPPEVPKFIKQYFPDTHYSYPEHSFYYYIRNWFPPTRTKRWC